MNRAAQHVLPWALALLVCSSGCVAVYQPLSGMHDPVVVDPTLGNLHDVRILVHCVPQEILDGEAGLLCQRIKTLFENQGAEVRTVTSIGRSAEDETFEAPVEAEPSKPEQAEPGSEAKTEGAKEEKAPPPRIRPHLIVELRARHLHEHVDYPMWTLSWFTGTLAPGISENTFVQEVVIRGPRGSLLGQGELKGRIVRYFGLGYWAVNGLLDLLFRDDDEELSDSNLSDQLSTDLYGQLSQMVFNANMRRRVLDPEASPTKKKDDAS
ncbi:MAG: hypothetical protein RIT81_16925 [Deltaproteobacteria bacterium]